MAYSDSLSYMYSLDSISSLNDIATMVTMNYGLDPLTPSILSGISTNSTSINGLSNSIEDTTDPYSSSLPSYYMSDCANLVDSMLDSVVGALNSLVNGELFGPIMETIESIWDALGLEDLSSVSSLLSDLGSIISSAVSVVGDIANSLLEATGLKDTVMSLLSSIGMLIGCGEDLANTMSTASPALVSPEMTTAMESVTYAQSVASPTDTTGDIMNIAKSTAVSELGLDTQVENVNSTLTGLSSSVTNGTWI